MPVVIGTAGWSIGSVATGKFPTEGTNLERYAAVFAGAEINSSFHRSHRLSTWQRWADAVPADFRFSVKMPKIVSHQHRLVHCEAPLDLFLEEVRPLGGKLAIFLLQLPPKFAFDAAAVVNFFAVLRSRCGTPVVCEPRHPSWFEPEADALLQSIGVARVAADPALHRAAGNPGGWRGLSYFRLHGSPVMYRSSYSDRIEAYARQLKAEADERRPTWCIFDNTASSAAIGDALLLQNSLAMLKKAQVPAGTDH